jgi:hypothetical protein
MMDWKEYKEVAILHFKVHSFIGIYGVVRN